MIHVTAHAVSRYRERVEPVGYDEAVSRLRSATIAKAAELGASAVILANGCRVILEGSTVVTVKPKRGSPRKT